MLKIWHVREMLSSQKRGITLTQSDVLKFEFHQKNLDIRFSKNYLYAINAFTLYIFISWKYYTFNKGSINMFTLKIIWFRTSWSFDFHVENKLSFCEKLKPKFCLFVVWYCEKFGNATKKSLWEVKLGNVQNVAIQ